MLSIILLSLDEEDFKFVDLRLSKFLQQNERQRQREMTR